jgi:uncharacterized protein
MPDPTKGLPSPLSDGRLAENILYFARLLRSAGLPVGPGRVFDAVAAVKIIGFENQEDFYWCLFSLFVTRNEQRELFDQAFHIFWRNPRIMERMLGTMLPMIEAETANDMDSVSRRLADALQSQRDVPMQETVDQDVEFDASLTFSACEVLQEKDFEDMTAAEIEEAKQLIAKMTLSMRRLPTRRFEPSSHGPLVDLRGTLRASLRSPNVITLTFRKRQKRYPPLVILCDISGSMARYSRMFLHFMHSVSNDRDRVHTFVFATRLTNISRSLRHRDVDAALDHVAAEVKDWGGGTRIGDCLSEFNRLWSRRVLSQGAITLIISDGLDREGAQGIELQMDRLARSSRRMVWLNPLLRFDAFEPKASGVRAMLPYVDDFKSVHNLRSLQQLTEVLQ